MAKYCPTLSEKTVMGKLRWVEMKILLPILCRELFPQPWDVKSKLYSNRIKKRRVLHELENEYNTSTNEKKRKLYNLKTQFHSELMKL